MQVGRLCDSARRRQTERKKREGVLKLCKKGTAPIGGREAPKRLRREEWADKGKGGEGGRLISRKKLHGAM